jgi:hypothetical protein
MPMNLLILGGMSPGHHEWVRHVAEKLGDSFDSVRFLDYRHWETGEAMDIEHEVSEAAVLAEGLDEYVLVAKSIGTVVATLAISRGMPPPKHCVFMGFPLSGIEGEIPEVADALPALPLTVFVHNEFDKVGTAEAAKKYVQAHTATPALFITVPGVTTHDYEDYALIKKLALVTPS